MELSQHKIEPFDYQGGADFINRLKEVYSVSHRMDLSNIIGVSNGTMSTWRTRNQTPFEIAVRVHLASGVSLKWLLLGEGDMYDSSKSAEESNQAQLPYAELEYGELTDKGTLLFDTKFLDENPEYEMVLKYEGKTLFVDTSNTKIISGRYLVEFDGVTSINELHRIPGEKIYMNFNGKDIAVEEAQIKVLGKLNK
ncbi:phage repressor protein CI [Photobacterium lutimaris]|uniref:Transcriptional regulator n=1 Tax=Photobacterium lutimaris TaxID=388278 RepID=A0A2T3J1M4_9GAMM|nr:phage repressor protein CI [Photobacterium lutimaris]PSU34982.1 transcriptional regulator [Photobacterium lutimaris]TDR77337.1 bacteriophage CI repressor-like protein [Photobacterium lutimaris]